MFNVKNVLILLLVVGVSSYYTGRYVQPPQVKTEYVDREVVKKDVKTVIKEVVKSDGSKEIVTTIDDNSVEKKDVKQTIAVEKKRDYTVSVIAKTASITSAPSYAFQIDKRVVGPFGLTLSAATDKQFGIGLSYEF